MHEDGRNSDRDVSRSEVAEYLHDMSGQLSEMARRVGLMRAAEALERAQRAVESEF